VSDATVGEGRSAATATAPPPSGPSSVRVARQSPDSDLKPGKGAHGLRKPRGRRPLVAEEPPKLNRKQRRHAKRRARRRRPLPVRIVLGVVSLIVTVAMVALAVFVVAVAVLSGSGLYRTTTVLTGSMANLYPPGTVVLLERQSPELIRKGDVIAFVPPQAGTPVLHRVEKIIDESATRGNETMLVEDNSEGAGEGDMITVRIDPLDASVPGLEVADRPNPLIITKGDTNPIIDTWSPFRVEDDVWVPKSVPYVAPGAVVSFGPVLRFMFENPLASRVIAGIAMLLIGWPLVAGLWKTARYVTGDWEPTDDEEVVRNSRRWSGTEGRGGVTVAPEYDRPLDAPKIARQD
jgi:signal peptidase I